MLGVLTAAVVALAIGILGTFWLIRVLRAHGIGQPIHDVVMQKAIGGYQFWFHREPDYRQFVKG